jgi:phosphate transport system substrate-binding protein
MFEDYHQQTGVRVNYQGIGSGGGIRQLFSKTVDFGGTDAIVSEDRLAEADGEILHIPICLGAVVVTYNIPGNPRLKMTPDIIADIYLGNIDKWNDDRLVELNPGINLPNLNIAVVRRSDGSGTTSIFSNYLSKVSSDWKERVGEGTSLNWPVGLGARGNPGVAGMVQQLPGAIGYVELIYAMSNNLPYADVQNRSGNFVEPTIGSVSLAADIDLPDDTMVSLTDTDAAQGYPISGFTWIIIYRDQDYGRRSRNQALETKKLLEWMIGEGQKHAEPLHYAPLSTEAVRKARALLDSVTYNGQPLK